MAQAPAQLRAIAADLEAGGHHRYTAAILALIAADVELLLAVFPAALVADDSDEVLPLFVRVIAHPDGSLAVNTVEQVDFPRAAHLHVAIPGRPVVVLEVGGVNEQGIAVLSTLDPNEPTAPTPLGMCPVPGHTMPGPGGETIALPVVSCRTCFEAGGVNG